MKSNIKRITGYFYLVYPVFIVAALYTFCIVSCHMQYYSNDDTSIHNVLSGEYTGSPYAIHQFINIALGLFVSRLYMLFPEMPWWYIYSQLIILCGILILNYSIINFGKKNGVSFLVPAIIVFIFDFVIFLYPVANISFTIVPSVLGAGIVTMIMSCDMVTKEKKRLLVCLLLFVLVVFHRSAVAKVTACYIILAFFHIIFSQKENVCDKIRKFLLAIIIVIGSVFLIGTVNNLFQSKIQGSDFEEFNQARIEYVDYTHDDYSENKQVYEHVGWSENLWRMVNHWAFMDVRVTAENMNYIVEHSKKAEKTMDPFVLAERWDSIKHIPLIDASKKLWILTAVLALISLLIRHEQTSLFTYFFNVLGTVILVVYQLYLGRILYRTFIILMIPSLSVNFLLFIQGFKNTKTKWRKLSSIAMALFFLFLTVMTNKDGLKYSIDENIKEEYQQQEQCERMVGEYAIKNQGNIYIKNVMLTENKMALTFFPNEKPYNLFVWGDSVFLSACDREKLKNNELDALNADVMRRENAFLITRGKLDDSEKEYLEGNGLVDFFMWLRNDYGACGIKQVDTIFQNVGVFKIVFDEDKIDDETYDYIGGHFYPIRYSN